MGQRPLVATGIHGLDVQLGGGVPEGSLILLIGESTNAMYTFMEQFAASSVGLNIPVRWIELDRPAADVAGNIQRFVEGSGKGKLDVLEATSTATEPPEGFTRIEPTDAVQTVVRSITEAGTDPYRLVVTSLTSVLDSMSEDEGIEFMRRLAYMVRSSQGVVLLSMLQEAHPPAVVARLKHLASGVMEIGLERKGFGLYSYLKVEKLMGVADPTKLLLFSETDKGLRLESTRRVL